MADTGPTLPDRTVAIVRRHLCLRLQRTDSCDHVGRLVTTRDFAPWILGSAQAPQHTADRVLVARAGDAYRELIEFARNGTEFDRHRIGLAVGFGSAVAPNTVARILPGLLARPDLEPERLVLESAGTRIAVEFSPQLTSIDHLFRHESRLRVAFPDRSWQHLVDVLPHAYQRGGENLLGQAAQRIPDVIDAAPTGEPRIRLHNVLALTHFRAGDYSAAENELRAARGSLDTVSNLPLRVHLAALLESNWARMDTTRDRIRPAYERIVNALTDPRGQLEPSVFWFHARRGCAIAQRCGRTNEYWALVEDHSPPVDELAVESDTDEFRICKSYQAFLRAAAGAFSAEGRIADARSLLARRGEFLNTRLPGWNFLGQ